MTAFQYDSKIIKNYPHITAGVIIANNMNNPPTSDSLRQVYLAEQAAVKSRLADTALSELESLAAWRRAISAFGVSPTKYRSAAEALLRRLTKKGDIPSINTLVDIGNLVSIRYGLPVAIFDTREIQGAVTVHYADGTEHYMELGSNKLLHPAAGEVIFSDEKRMVVARRWCWRQSATSAANHSTTHAIITVEAHHQNALNDIEKATRDLLSLLHVHAGGTCESAILHAENPAI